MVDPETQTVHVIGGEGESFNDPLTSTETLNLNENKWEIGSGLPESVFASSAVASKSSEYVGYLVGGAGVNTAKTGKIWQLRRGDLTWLDSPRVLQTPRYHHTAVNVNFDDIPGCFI